MHQEHTIPWNSVASHFKFVRENPHYTPRRTGLSANGLPTQSRTLNHFARVLSTTITSFSETERAKYGTSFHTPMTGPIFSDEFRDRHPEYLNVHNQRIEFWIESARTSPYTEGMTYSSSDGELADVVKVLVNENQMETIFMLARHPKIPLDTLWHLSGQWFGSGFSRIMEAAMQAYLLLNLCAATNALDNREYLEMEQYGAMICQLTDPSGMEFNGEQVPHREYLNKFSKDSETGFPEVHHDLESLKEYLKSVFRLLYRYDMLLKECGLDPVWESEIIRMFKYHVGIGVKVETVVVGRSVVYRLP